MAASLKGTKTMENLMRAFAGESQARNRYTFAAACAKKKQLYVIEQVFQFTANQEKEHAEVFYNCLLYTSGAILAVGENLAVLAAETIGGEPAVYSKETGLSLLEEDITQG